MSFLEVNGLNVDVDLGSFDRDNSDIQTFSRVEGLSLEGTLYAAKREWDFKAPWEPVEAVSLAITGWVKGRGHYYTFERVDGATTRFNKYSTDGGPGFDSQLTSHATSKFGSWCGFLLSGASSSVTVTFGSEGRYSVSAWRASQASTTYALHSFVYDGTTIKMFDGASLVASHCFAKLTAASGYLSVTLEARLDGGTSSTSRFDGLMVVPYAMSTPQLAARVARTRAEPPFPYVELDGDCLEDLTPVTVKGFVASEGMTQVTRNGTVNARMLKIQLIER